MFHRVTGHTNAGRQVIEKNELMSFELLRIERKAAGGSEWEQVSGGAQCFPGGGISTGLEGFESARSREMQRLGAAEIRSTDHILDRAKRSIRMRLS